MLKDSGSRAVNSIRNMLNQLGSTLDINNMPEAKFITNLPWDCTLDQACKWIGKWKHLHTIATFREEECLETTRARLGMKLDRYWQKKFRDEN